MHADGDEIVSPFTILFPVSSILSMRPISKLVTSWPTGKTETKSDSLKSLMAIYLFRKKVNDYTAQGVNFKGHLYVPEVDEEGEAI